MCEPCWRLPSRARHTGRQGRFSTREKLPREQGVHRMHLGVGSAGAQGGDAFCGGAYVISTRKTQEEEGRRHVRCQSSLEVSVIFGTDCKWCYINC